MRRYNNGGCRHQKGAALIVFIFLIGIALTTYLIKSLNSADFKLAHDEKTMQSLGAAKEALIAWAVSNSEHLGQLPYPDRAGTDGYDGFSDCPSPAATFSDDFLIGQLPVYGQTNPCVSPQLGLGLEALDAEGNRLWYAVSHNVVHEYGAVQSDPVINPDIINNPVHPWLKVVDRNGTLVSDRVAAVIIAPGNALANQNRSATAPPNQFLDSFQKGGTLYANSDYDSPDEDFVMGDALSRIDDNDASFGRPYLFNDKLVFITIDELINALDKRVAAEGKWLLNAYQSKRGQFPNAADLSSATINSNQYFSGLSKNGLLPIDVTDTCQCTDASTCNCSFGLVDSVTLYRQSGTWNSSEDAGACHSNLKPSGKECTCTGAGSCSRTFATSSTSFSCDTAGACGHTLSPDPNNQFSYTLPAHLQLYSADSGCAAVGGSPVCTDAGDFKLGLNAPDWFKANNWQAYVYYAWSDINNLQAGTKNNLSALLIMMGQPIIAPELSELGVSQTRPSDLIADYLDSAENTNNDTIFEAVNKTLTKQYNDQVFIVAP